ncbi:tetratricopeptide repeat protein [Desulfovibrio gilichinskyi]|uniref:Tetratricopeptide repeat-containing protein n=1 Tax=Desulfovibrio gilichinskyi TaxID=1519643 RepID=A0A1X7DNK3_9BACT|nr:tetratricopeptide repeat protein [Desulfovibrio gilichinskyi]SMF18820.1 Tetratricopeptide repeat-containing protein [Desulfovibrio gilichinskyi]
MAAFIWLACPHSGLAMQYYINTKSDMDSLRLVFDQKNLDSSVRRTGRQQITISFPAGSLKGEKAPAPMPLSGMRVVDSVKIGANSIVIGTRMSGFGFIRLPGGNGEMVLQFFRDPIGSKWRSPVDNAKLAAAQKTKADAQKAEAAKKAAAQRSAAQQAAARKSAAQKTIDQNIVDQQKAVSDAKPPILEEIDITPENDGQAIPIKNDTVSPDSGPRRPFYSVPYTYRSPVSKVGPEDAAVVDTSSPPSRAGGDSSPVTERVAVELPAGSSGGTVGGIVAPPPPFNNEGAISGQTQPVEDQTGGSASGAITPPEPVQAAANSIDGGTAVEVVSPPPPLPPAQVSGSVATPPEPSVAAAPGAGDAEINYGEVYNSTDVAEKPMDSTDAYPTEDAAKGKDGESKELTLEDKIKIAKGLLLAAETALEDGEIQAAVDGFKDVAAMSYLPKDLRIKAVYGKAEALTELHKDDLKNNFGTVSSSWMEAMNSDTNSPNVPMALLNLGLVNLKAGNMPEAKAYFNLLKSQYPNDLNIPYISYYWGEYYLGMHEYEKAADQFQNLVQSYPDSKVVREAALGLAKSLNALGYNKQAYQIIDYIDKRWPRYYIEDLNFLLMAANTQNKLGKLDDAKKNYWAFYNLNPESKENDTVLARIGDIYLKSDDMRAAKEIYEKAAKDYPDEEGGLVSKMRLAEEGIYDDPNMNQMDKVFDRPYNLRPQKIYTEIVKNHPDSPLAPLAQLKLAMWYYWNKKYGDCLGAVQDFMDKYPRSSMHDKASELGYRVFDKAVPDLVKDENYGRVVKFWDSYAKKNNDGDGVSDETRLGVALSYWKKEQPDAALKLIDRYLKEKQIPKYSAMALDMALGIYVDGQEWSKVSELADMVQKNWDIDPKQKAHIEYANAMAYENLGETESSTPLWAGLAANLQLPESSRAYAMYYMAKSAMKQKELKKVFVYSQEALSMLLETGGDREKIKDCILMTIYAAESSGRYREALQWASEYDKYIPISDPEWASSRFRLAQLYEKAGATAEWKKLMEEVAKKSPDGLYGRLAKSALETSKIERDASKFVPSPSM